MRTHTGCILTPQHDSHGDNCKTLQIISHFFGYPILYPEWSLFSGFFFFFFASLTSMLSNRVSWCVCSLRMYLFPSPHNSVNSVWHSWWVFNLMALLLLLRLLHFQKCTNTANMITDILAWANRGKLSFKNFLLAGNIEVGKILANTLPPETLTPTVFLLCSYFMCFVYFLLT